MAPIEAILFDLYGTLVKIGRRSIHRDIPRLLGVDRRRWVELLRRDLMTQRFEDAAAFVRHICDALAPGREPATEERCVASVRSELDSVRCVQGTISLLHFLKRRGHRLGVVSNLSSPHKEPLMRLGLTELFEAAAFSCDEGVAKPEQKIYRDACDRLGIPPSRVLFVGDSLPNDVEGPAKLGMRTAGIGVAGDARLEKAGDLGRLLLSGAAPFQALFAPGDVLEIGSRRHRIESIEPIPDSEQGRYNLVFRVRTQADGRPDLLYCKRFLDPQTASVEEFAYELQQTTGLPACDAAAIEGCERYLAISAAPGGKYAGELNPAVAYELGKHFVFAFLFSNADIRPRNAFLSDSDGACQVTLIDLEHCFFNLALDVAGVGAPLRPATFDRMPPDELARRIKKRVLSQRATSRARRSFFGDTPRDSPLTSAFRKGFVDFYAKQRAESERLCNRVAERIDRDPPLIIGTLSYRRAMAHVDLEDIRSRLAMEPEAAFEWCY